MRLGLFIFLCIACNFFISASTMVLDVFLGGYDGILFLFLILSSLIYYCIYILIPSIVFYLIFDRNIVCKVLFVFISVSYVILVGFAYVEVASVGNLIWGGVEYVRDGSIRPVMHAFNIFVVFVVIFSSSLLTHVIFRINRG